MELAPGEEAAVRVVIPVAAGAKVTRFASCEGGKSQEYLFSTGEAR